MKNTLPCLVVFLLILSMSAAFAQDAHPVTLTGWGVREKDLDAFMSDAADTGFDSLISGNNDPVALQRIVEAAAKHHIRIFSCITPMGTIGKLWASKYPGRPVPWQVMNEDEEAARKFIMAGSNQYLIPYSFGGEPKLTNEVLSNRIICFSDPQARELFKPVIDGIASVPGIEGLAFDGFGYQNYHRCYCERCEKLLAEYKQKHPELKAEEAEVAFFRDSMVDYLNYLADYARSRNKDLKTTIHIWPVFTPEPLYGNRLNVDLCGQTAAWYILWPEEKIAEYSRIISGEATKYHERQQGVGMIGYYDLPGKFPVKDAARVDLELKTMIDNGCRSIQVCSSIHVMNNPQIRAVFKKWFSR